MSEPRPRPFHDSYKRYTESGFLVSPLDETRPHSVTGGLVGDRVQCAKWLPDVPEDANVGVQIPKGIVVVTVDPEQHGPQSLWDARTKREAQFPRTLVASTSRGGLQIWFYGETVSDPHSSPMPGVYVTGHPRLIPVPPSIGTNGVQTRWLNSHRVADLPEALHDPLGIGSPQRRPSFVDCLHSEPVALKAATKLLNDVLGPTT